MSIDTWPEQEKPREKLLTNGVSSLNDSELIAVLIGHGTRGKSAVDLAREALNQYGGLRGFVEAGWNKVSSFSGIGIGKYTRCLAAIELGRRHLEEPLKRETILNNPTLVSDYLLSRLREHENEVFAAIFLDAKLRLIAFEKLFFGTVNTTNIYPRVLIKRCLAHNAHGVIISHNHPSGNPDPSQADIQLTKHLKKMLANLEIRLLDHIICGDTETISFKELGLLID